MNYVTIIGAGNVGSHLYTAFVQNNVPIEAIWSRTTRVIDAGSGRTITTTTDLDFSKSTSELFILCLPDDAIASVLTQLKVPHDAIVAHTSGSVNMNVLQSVSARYGIFYPLQTFTKGRAVDFRTIPMLLEASDAPTLQTLESLAQLISDHVQACDSTKRAQIHLAAVFACNFTNRILGISEELLQSQGGDLSLLQPLVEETLKKSFELGPTSAQTGPAHRGDQATMDKHLRMLEGNKEYQALYAELSSLIQRKKD